MQSTFNNHAARAEKPMEASDTIESAKALIKATENIPPD